MANFSYEDYEKKSSSAGTTDFKVGYFGLKDDGDEAIVRFNYSSVKDFNIVTVHNIKTTNKEGKEFYKRVSCLRGVNDPMDKCPLCARGSKLESKLALKLYVKLIEYVKTDDGRITPKAKVWERPASFAGDLKTYLDEYGDLSDFIFKIKRRGVRGSLQTTYDIIPTRPEIYKPEIYVKDFSDFNDFKLAGSNYLVKTAEEMNIHINTGAFPKTVRQPEESKPVVATTPSITPTTTPATPVDPVVNKPQSQENPLDGRPKRYTF